MPPLNLKDRIGLIVVDQLNVAYRYLRKSEENIAGDSSAYPAIVFIEPDQGGWVNNAQGTRKRFTNCFFQFLKIYPEMGDNASQRDDDIEEMKILAERFFNQIDRTDDFEMITTDFQFVTIIERYDVNTVGIEVNIPKLIYTYPTPC